MKNYPPMHIEGCSRTPEGIVVNVNLTEEYVMFSNLIDFIVSKNDLMLLKDDPILNKDKVEKFLKVYVFKCYVECFILYTDPMDQVIDLQQVTEDVLQNSINGNYNVNVYEINKINSLLNIINYKFNGISKIKNEKPDLLNNESFNLNKMETMFSVIIKNIFTKIFKDYKTKHNTLVNIEEGDVLEIVSWTENQTSYDWTNNNQNELVIVTLKFIP